VAKPLVATDALPRRSSTFGERSWADAYAATLIAQGYLAWRGQAHHAAGKAFIDWAHARGRAVHALDDQIVVAFDKRNRKHAPSRDERLTHHNHAVERRPRPRPDIGATR
jgi:hypothetical protein